MTGKLRAGIFVFFGHMSLLTGIIGIILPILPTTPFVILACGCYARGSKKCHAMIVEHRYLGPIIAGWKKYGSIPIRAKLLAGVMIVVSIIWTMVSISIVAVQILVAIIGIGIIAYIFTRPSRKL